MKNNSEERKIYDNYMREYGDNIMNYYEYRMEWNGIKEWTIKKLYTMEWMNEWIKREYEWI
jgi:hypothetical protein